MTAVSAAVALVLLAPAQPPAKSDPVDVKESVAKGLKWLAAQQELEGNWFGRANSAPTTTTAMAGLALLMEGSTPKTGTYAPNLRKAVEWMEKNAAVNGSLVGTNRTDTARPMTAHAEALLFLACAYDVDDDPARRERLGRILDRAIAYAVTEQTARGGWRLAPARGGINDDALTTATVLHALLAARKVGIEVPRNTTNKAIDYLAKATTPSGAVFRNGVGADVVGGALGYLTSGAVAALLVYDGPRPAAFVRWLQNLQSIPPQPWPRANANANAMSAQLHLARLTFALGENGHRALDPDVKEASLMTWSGYRAKVFPSIKAAQAAEGNWPNTVPGPVYGSAVALVILQLENDYLPAFSR